MRIKLDENMPSALTELLRRHGHDVTTVAQQRLAGSVDERVARVATAEGRVLLTFDHDFGDIRAYPIGTHAGIVVFRLEDQRWAALEKPARSLIDSGLLERLHGGLAIVDRWRIRIRSSPPR